MLTSHRSRVVRGILPAFTTSYCRNVKRAYGPKMEPAMLMLVTDRDESLRAFEAFESAFTVGAALFPNHYVGFQGGHQIVNVHWHGSAGIWGVFEREAWDQSGRPLALGRFWAAFGVDDPSKRSSLNITVEMNPPREGENRRTAGVLLRDEAGGFYIGHTGKVGGGRRGIGPRKFRDFGHHLPWQEITTPSGPREVVVFGPFQERGLLSTLARYVHTVAEFKDQIATGLR